MYNTFFLSTLSQSHMQRGISISLDLLLRRITSSEIPAELYSRDAIRKSTRISNPGCYSTNTQLILAPLLPYIKADSQPTIFGVSGYSGAGTKSGNTPKITPESLRGGIKPYSLTDHIHEREAAYHLSSLLQSSSTDVPFSVGFIPHVAPWFQGIISTASIHLKDTMRAEDVRKLYEEMYKGEKLLKVQKEIPEVADASGKHGWTVGGFQVHSSGKRAVVVVSFIPLLHFSVVLHTDDSECQATLDNLLKGAATQCMQNINLSLGLDEYAGIPLP